jgi:hypothetical protein
MQGPALTRGSWSRLVATATPFNRTARLIDAEDVSEGSHTCAPFVVLQPCDTGANAGMLAHRHIGATTVARESRRHPLIFQKHLQEIAAQITWLPFLCYFVAL